MRSLLGKALAALCVSVASPALAAASAADSSNDLANLSIEQLAQIEVRSVSKRDEPLSAAPAALYVIDHDQIVRSGAVTIPDILRLAPNLQVYQSTPSHWSVTARGLNGNPGFQSFSNKLLVLIDGRTVYTPLFSGVYWDLPDLLPDDIERIEVISGPGATLWGANAVNGVVNIITRNAGSTAGAYADIKAGESQQAVGLRIAGTASPTLNYRVYARWLHQDAEDLRAGGSAKDDWHRLGGGFRLDWTPTDKDTVTFQGDIFGGRDSLPGAAHENISGRDLVLRWNRQIRADQQLQVQAFYDRIARGVTPSSPALRIDTYDLDVQHSLAAGSRNTIVWGGGARLVDYRIDDTSFFFFEPPSRNLVLANLFVQDTLELNKAVSVTAGLKAERDYFVGVSLLPNIHIAVRPSDTTLLWGAVSRAVRSPTPFDEDAQERLGTVIALSGNPDFRTEKLTAYELGVRSQPMTDLSLSLTGFYHQYDDLRSIELIPGPALINFQWANGLKGHSYGLEAWASASPFSWWTLSAGAMLLHEKFRFKEGASGLGGTSQNGVDPGHRFTLRSSMDLGPSVTLDLSLRAFGHLKHLEVPDRVPAYTELGGRLAWNVSDHFALTLSGSNLLHARHVEYPGGDAISRKVLVGVELRR